MFYRVPTIVFQERECVKSHREELSTLGKKALIVTGRNSARKNGALDDVIEVLESEQISYCVFDQVEENPCIETVMAAREYGINEAVDFVIAIGGGSPIDAAKAISLMIYNRNEDATFLYKTGIKASYLPIVAIPTTCGTGSEVTPVSVITVHEKKTKASLPHKIYPRFAFVDIKYLKCAPHRIIQTTAVDALGHMIESYINTGATDYSKMFVDAGLKIWSRSKDVLIGKRQAQDADYENLLVASTLAGMAIAHDGTTIPHSLSYILTYEGGVSHGAAIGYFQPGYLNEADKADRDYILVTSGFSDLEEFKEFIDLTCGVGKIAPHTIARTVDYVLGNKAKLATCPYKIDEDVLWRIVNY